MLGAKCWQDQEALFGGTGVLPAEQNGLFQQVQSEQKYQLHEYLLMII